MPHSPKNPTDGQPAGHTTSAPATPTHDAALARIENALQGLRYGSVLAIVQDGIVVQIERTEKTRLDKLGR